MNDNEFSKSYTRLNFCSQKFGAGQVIVIRFAHNNYLITAKISPSLTRKNSSSFSPASTSLSQPELKTTLEPTFTDIGIKSPSSPYLPGPTATTSPIFDFSFCAVSGIMMPAGDFLSSESNRFTKTRSARG